MALFHSLKKSLSFHGKRFHWMIYTLVLVKLMPSLAPERAEKELRFSVDFLSCLLIQSIKCTMQFHPQPLFRGATKSQHRRFHFISNYLVLQNIRLCHWRSRKTKNSNKEFSLGALAFRPDHCLILSKGSGTKRLQVNQGCGGLFFGVMPLLLRQF